MLLVRHPEDMENAARGAVVALGNFDGFHRGHQVVVGEAGRLARAQNRPLGLFTTEPHPRTFFAPDAPSFRLTPLRERSILFERFGVDVLFLPIFDARLAGTSARDFVTDMLINGFGVSHVVAGYDYQFGKGREGNAELLQHLAKELGIGATIIEPVGLGGGAEGPVVFSSSAVREALREGRPRLAAEILGHWWSVNGRVAAGEQRGRTIGFPTANLGFGETIEPRHGVYAVRASFDGLEDQILNGVANVGVRPTFEGRKTLLEAHIFDFDGDLYDRHARIEFVDFIRDEQKFQGIDALKAQIAADCTVARKMLQAPENQRAQFPFPTLDRYLAAAAG